MKIMRWILAAILAVFFVFMGIQKFGPDENIVFAILAENSGISLFEPQIRLVTGIAEIFAGILLIIPKMRVKGALLGLAILIGALGFHLSPWLGINVPGIGNGLFMAALGALVLNLAVLGLEKADQKITALDKL